MNIEELKKISYSVKKRISTEIGDFVIRKPVSGEVFDPLVENDSNKLKTMMAILPKILVEHPFDAKNEKELDEYIRFMPVEIRAKLMMELVKMLPKEITGDDEKKSEPPSSSDTPKTGK